MNEEMKQKYEEAIEFWNKALCYSEEDFQGETDKNEDWKAIGSESLYKLMCEKTAGLKNVLDYGCGNGWLEVIMAKNGVTGITAVDVAPQAVSSAKLYAKAFDVVDGIDFKAVNVDWLSKEPGDSYDNAVCCNVLDVIPTEVSESILENLARVCKKGATVLITLNPCFSADQLSREGMEYKAPYLFMNGVLRVNNHDDEFWKELMTRYFEVQELKYFKWDQETKEARRFFILKKV